MRNTVQKIAILLIGVMIAVLGFVPIAYASSADVGIEPAYPKADNERTQSIFIMKLKPGEQGADGIHLVNSGKESHTVEIYATDSSSSVDGSFSCRQHAEPVKDVGKWVNLDKTKLTLDAGQQTIVSFTVTVPTGAGPGEHDGCIAVQDIANLPAASGSGVLLGFRSAIRLAVTVPGKILKNLTIKNVEIKRVANREISVSPIARNGGNVSLDVTARAQLVSIFGQETKVRSDAKYPIMQGATTGWAYTFEGPYWGGIYKARTSLSYNSDPNTGLGQGDSNQQRVRKDSGWFVAFPAPLAAAAEVMVLVAIVWTIITPFRRRLRRRHTERYWQKHVVVEGETLATIAKIYDIQWKKIARHNHIKAPYLVEAGRTILVPKPKKKISKHSKVAPSDFDWLTNDAPSAPEVVAVPATAPLTGAEPDRSATPDSNQAAPTAAPSRAEWYSPQGEPSIYESRERPVMTSPHATQSAVPNPLFPEPEEDNSPDWREGASDEELRQLGIITDSASVTPLQGSWSIDDEADIPKKPASKRRPSPKRTQKSATKKASSKRSTKKQ
jgi:LysM repeat protein